MSLTNMSQTAVTAPASGPEPQLPHRDLIVLPLIALTTLALIIVASEAVARVVWPEQERDACYIPYGPDGGHFAPNCTSRTKIAEGPWVNNFYNSCGYRTLEPCGPKPPGTIRIAVLGSSYGYGYGVPYQSTFTTLSGKMLSRECQRHVELQNLAVPDLPLEDSYYRTQEALALKPDLLLLVLTPWDVSKFVKFDTNASSDNGAQSAQNMQQMNFDKRVRNDILNSLQSSRASVMLRHYMYRNPTTYLRLSLGYGSAADYADYLRPTYPTRWHLRFSNLETLLRNMSEKARASSVPMVLLVGPTEAQAALVNTTPRDGLDPEAFETEIARIASNYAIATINPLPGFARQSDPMDMFYSFNGHTAPRGQRLIADAVNKALAGRFPAFAGCSLR